MTDWAVRYPWARSCERHPDFLLAAERVPRREDWGPGPWQDEPDLVQWTTEAGLPGMAWRTPWTGCWCGYAAVERGHPYFERDWGAIEQGFGVHYGLTYSGRFEPHETCWWLGFDCGHCDDLMPALAAQMRALRGPEYWAFYAAQGVELPLPPPSFLGLTYRDLDYVHAQVEDLARELVAAASGKAALDEALSTKAEENQ